MFRFAAMAVVVTLAMSSAAFAAPAHPAVDPKAQAVIDAAKAAAGGAVWDKMAGWHEIGVHNGARYETWLDPHAWGMTTLESREGVSSAKGFDGKTTWFKAKDGTVTVDASDAAIADSKQSDYFSIDGYFEPARFPADVTYVGEQQEAGRTYDVLHFTPAGQGADIWFDRETHLPARGVIKDGDATIVIRLSDYQVVDGAAVPFHIQVSNGDPTHDDDGRITSLDFGAAPRSVFQAPAQGPATGHQ